MADQDEGPTAEVSIETLTVGDLMSASVATVREDQDLRTALQMFSTTGLRHLVVVRGDGEFVGVLGDRVGVDLAGQDERQLTISRVHDLPQDRRAQTTADTGIIEAARIVLHHSAGALAVTDLHGRVIGIITGADLLRGLLEIVDGTARG